VVKDDDLTSTKIEQLVANPITYISKSIEKKNVDLGSQKDTPIQAYQLFNNFNYNSSIVSFASIELSQKQEVGLSYFDYDMDASIYINGELVMSEKKGDINKFKVQLNKGKNAVIIVGDLIGGREPSFFAWFYGSQRGEIVGTIRDGGGKPVPFARVDIMGEKMNTSIITDNNGKYQLWINPNYGKYIIGSINNEESGYSKPIFVKEYGRYNIDIEININCYIINIHTIL